MDAAYSIFQFNFYGSHAGTSNTACFFWRRRVKIIQNIFFRKIKTTC